jgi:hypothetical protein
MANRLAAALLSEIATDSPVRICHLGFVIEREHVPRPLVICDLPTIWYPNFPYFCLVV